MSNAGCIAVTPPREGRVLQDAVNNGIIMQECDCEPCVSDQDNANKGLFETGHYVDSTGELLGSFGI